MPMGQMRLMLIDPKIVEFSTYNHLPHLVVPVITDPKKVALGLRWAINEMEKRYKLFARVGVRNIEAYNSRPIAKQEELFGERGAGRRKAGGAAAGPPALHRHRRRRTGRPDARGAGGDRERHRAAGPALARGRHPHDPRHPAAVGERHHRHDQGQLPGAHRLPGGPEGGQPHDPRRERRGQAAGPGRHALPAAGQQPARSARRAR